MAAYLGGGRVQEFLASGAFDVGGTIETYIAGTSTHRPTYPTITDAIAQTNAYADWPLELDEYGMVVAAINGPTDIIYKNSNGDTIYTIYGLDASSYNVYDSEGNLLVEYIENENAVNYIKISNAPSGQLPAIVSAGLDPNVGLRITAEDAGDLYLDGGATGKVIINSVSTGNIELRGVAIATETFTVTGATILSNTCSVAGTLVASSTFTAVGAVTLNSTLAVTGAATFNGNVTIDVNDTFNLMPAGTILAWGGAGTIPAGFLLCNGAAVSRAALPSLFTALGVTWGAGDGSTTFNLPNLNRKTLVGSGGSGTAILANTPGSTGGTETHTLTTLEMPAHTHDYGLGTAGANYGAGAAGTPFTATVSTPTSSTGGGTAHTIMQPSAVVQYIVRY